MLIALLQKAPVVPADISPRPKSGEFRFHSVLLLIAVTGGVVLQAFGPGWAREILAVVRLDSAAKVAALGAALLLSVLAHEMGHLLASWSLNFEVLGGALGPIRFDWWRNRIFPSFQGGNWSRCSISAVPREIHNAWRARMLSVVAAGPAVTLLLLIMSGAMALRGDWQICFWAMCAEVNFFLFTLGLIPNGHSSAARNDAALFVSLWKNDSEAEELLTCHRAIELTLQRMRPNQFPVDVLLELANFSGRPYTNFLIARRMVEWTLDNGDIAQANKWDRAALAHSEQCARRHANIALAESACFDVLFRDDLRAALHKFSNVDFEELFPPSLLERARAAHLVACDLPHRAPGHILRAQYQLPLGDPYFNYDRMLLDTLHTKALAKTYPPGLRQY